MKQMNVVLIGGGTGLSVLVEALENFNRHYCHCYCSGQWWEHGKIRDVMDIPAPGDIRNVIAALSDSESILTSIVPVPFW